MIEQLDRIGKEGSAQSNLLFDGDPVVDEFGAVVDEDALGGRLGDDGWLAEESQRAF